MLGGFVIGLAPSCSPGQGILSQFGLGLIFRAASRSPKSEPDGRSVLVGFRLFFYPDGPHPVLFLLLLPSGLLNWLLHHFVLAAEAGTLAW